MKLRAYFLTLAGVVALAAVLIGQDFTEELPVPDPIPVETVEEPPSPVIEEPEAELQELKATEPIYFEYELATSAQILPGPDGKVRVLRENPEQGGLAAMFGVNDDEITFVEVRRSGQLRDQILKPLEGMPGMFFVEGSPGEVAAVRIPNRDGFAFPIWLDLEFPGKPDDPPPGGGDGGGNEDLENLSRARADALGDPRTRSAIKAAVEKVLGEAEKAGSVEDAAQIVVKAIEGYLRNRDRDDPSNDVPWKQGWRVPVGEALKRLGPETAAEYVDLYRSVLKGL